MNPLTDFSDFTMRRAIPFANKTGKEDLNALSSAMFLMRFYGLIDGDICDRFFALWKSELFPEL